jgi:hypothetical protein
MNKILLIFFLVLPYQAMANVICTGIPNAVYAGVHGPAPNGSTYWVSIPNVGILPLGLATSDMAKARFSLAQTAFVAKKTFTLQYYSHTSCSQAQTDIATPTYAVISE